MKTINLSALAQFTLEDVCSFVSWLENVPATGISLERMKSNPPVRTSKIGPMLKVLEPSGLISRKQDRYTLTSAGKDFSRSGVTVRKGVMRNQFMNVDAVQRLLELLLTSENGRLPLKVVHESFNLGALSIATGAEIQGFISWAQACELFGFDKKAEEIFRMEVGVPRGPVEASKNSENKLTLPRAS